MSFIEQGMLLSNNLLTDYDLKNIFDFYFWISDDIIYFTQSKSCYQVKEVIN